MINSSAIHCAKCLPHITSAGLDVTSARSRNGAIAHCRRAKLCDLKLNCAFKIAPNGANVFKVKATRIAEAE